MRLGLLSVQHCLSLCVSQIRFFACIAVLAHGGSVALQGACAQTTFCARVCLAQAADGVQDVLVQHSVGRLMCCRGSTGAVSPLSTAQRWLWPGDCGSTLVMTRGHPLLPQTTHVHREGVSCWFGQLWWPPCRQ
jgi:hypothetical protein